MFERSGSLKWLPGAEIHPYPFSENKISIRAKYFVHILTMPFFFLILNGISNLKIYSCRLQQLK